MKNMTDLEKWKLLARYDSNQAVSEFSQKSKEVAADMSNTLGVSYMVAIVSQLSTDASAELLRNMPEDFCQKVLSELDPEKALPLKEILSYEPGTAGSLMAKECIWVPVHYTIGETTHYLQSIPQDQRGKVSYIYAVDDNRRIEGVIQVRDLVFYPPDKLIRDILISPVVQVETGMSQTDVANLFQRHRYLGLPVVDQQQKLVGVISADTVMHVFEKEAADDIAKIVGTSVDEIQAQSFHKIVRLRLPWLTVNIVSGLICAYISGIFQSDVPTIAALFLFIPVVLGLSESIGVQGATMVVRNLAMGGSSMKENSALFMREALAGIAIGDICGAVVGFFASLWKGHALLGLALASSMTLTIILSALIGLAMPFLFKRFKIDPAMASGPLVLALCDTQTLFIYFSLSSFILRQ